MNDEKNEIAQEIAAFRSDLNKVRLEGTEAEIDAIEEDFSDFLVKASKNGGFAEARKVANELFEKHFSEILDEFFYTNLIPFAGENFYVDESVYDDRFDFVFTDDVQDVRPKAESFILEEIVNHASRMKSHCEDSKVHLQKEISLVDQDIAYFDEQIKTLKNIKLS